MKIAIVHDFLNQKVGGAESVFLKMAEMFPEADLYALVYNRKKFKNLIGKRRIHTSSLQRLSGAIKNRPKYFLPFIKKAVDKWDFSDYDLVISSSTAWVKNIKISGKTKHLCYCHSPARMLWDSWPRYLIDNNIGRFKRIAVINLVSNIRLWDFYSTNNVTQFIANSNYVKHRIEKFYNRDAKVIYPPVKISGLFNNWKKSDYYLIISTLAKYKNIDLAIESFKKNKKKLIIAGEGADRNRLEALAKNSKNIKFVGYVSDKKKARLLALAKALIFCSIEDFGITPIEAMASVTPVIALRGGGLKETVIDKKTGIFFDQPTPQALNKAIDEYEKTQFKAQILLDQAKKFDEKIFARKLKLAVNNLLNAKIK